jgi:hypothetical protein
MVFDVILNRLLLIASLSPKSLINLKGMIILNPKHIKVEQKWHIMKFHFESFNFMYLWIIMFLLLGFYFLNPFK